jgi:hypothetical protein
VAESSKQRVSNLQFDDEPRRNKATRVRQCKSIEVQCTELDAKKGLEQRRALCCIEEEAIERPLVCIVLLGLELSSGTSCKWLVYSFQCARDPTQFCEWLFQAPV